MYSEKGNGRKAIVAYYLQKIRTKDSRHLKVSEYWVQPRKYTLLIFHTDKKNGGKLIVYSYKKEILLFHIWKFIFENNKVFIRNAV